MTSEQKQHLTRFLITDIEQELTDNRVSKSRIKEITNFFKKTLKSDRIYCVCGYNKIGQSVFKSAPTEEYNAFQKKFLKGFKCYGSEHITKLRSSVCNIEGTTIPFIIQCWEIRNLYEFNNYEKTLTYYVSADTIDNIINNL